ncbi:hypothetical protein GCM10008942_22650 [Rhizomicrobium electricum]|uniref:Uncharacterized protein n=1 Tax=Rhizomicrobium electricum TaxID=480070 RepID=A0ABP3PRA9_9PROT
MHAIGSFINKDRDGSVGSGIGYVLDHFLHDEGIAHYQPHALGRLGTSFATQDGAQVEFREKHKTRAAKGTLHNLLQIWKGNCRPRRIEEFDDVRQPDRRFERGHNSVE